VIEALDEVTIDCMYRSRHGGKYRMALGSGLAVRQMHAVGMRECQT
jgi:hypothetical protein